MNFIVSQCVQNDKCQRKIKSVAIPQHNAQIDDDDDDELTRHWVKNIKNHNLSSSQFT